MSVSNSRAFGSPLKVNNTKSHVNMLNSPPNTPFHVLKKMERKQRRDQEALALKKEQENTAVVKFNIDDADQVNKKGNDENCAPETVAMTVVKPGLCDMAVSKADKDTKPETVETKLRPRLPSAQQRPKVPVKMEPYTTPYRTVKSNEQSASSSNAKNLNMNRRKTRHVFKILVVGNSKCGKTSIIQRYTNDHFDEKYNITIGADYSKKVIESDHETIRLQLWDIAGQDRFANLTRPFYQHAKAAVIVCDVTRPNTLQAVRDWKRDLDDKLENFPCVIIANKCDLLTGIASAMELGARIENMCAEIGVDKWFIGSAKNSENIEQAMDFIVGSLLDDARKNSHDTERRPAHMQTIRLGSAEAENMRPEDNGCC